MMDFLNKTIMAGLIGIMGIVIVMEQKRCDALVKSIEETYKVKFTNLESDYNTSIENNYKQYQKLINGINDKIKDENEVNIQLQQTIMDDYKNVIPYSVWDMITTTNADRNNTLAEIRKLIRSSR